MAPLVLDMRASPPSVYLDQWALGTIAGDPALVDQFERAIVNAGGTLCLSWMNLAEFAQSSQRSIGEAERLLQRVWPRPFFLEPVPWTVIDRENALAAGGTHIAPHGDFEVLKALTFLDGIGLKPYTVDGLISQFAAATRSVGMAQLADQFVSRIEELRAAAAKDRIFWKRLTTVPRGPGIQAGMRFFVPQVLRPLVADRTKRLTQNDAIDFYHTAVPTCYCDCVLIDRHWATLTSQAIVRLRRAGHTARFANVIPAGPTAIKNLVQALTRGDAALGPA